MMHFPEKWFFQKKTLFLSNSLYFGVVAVEFENVGQLASNLYFIPWECWKRFRIAGQER